MVTLLYGSLLTLLLLKISIDTIRARRKHKISMGSGPNGEIAGIVGAHSNFVSYVPMLLMMSAMVEWSHTVNTFFMHVVLAIFTVGRVFHYLAFSGIRMNFRYRVLGMQMTIWPLAALAFYGLWISIQKIISV